MEAMIQFPSVEDSGFYVKNNLAAASDWETVSVKVLRYHKTYDLAKQTYQSFCKFPNYETGSDKAMGRGQRGRKKRSLTEESDTESSRPSKKTKLLVAAPVLPKGKKSTATGRTATVTSKQASVIKTKNPTAAASTSTQKLAAAPSLTIKKPPASIVVQSRGSQVKQKLNDMVAKSRSAPQMNKLDELEKRKQQILRDREKKTAVQEEKRLSLIEALRTGKSNASEQSSNSSIAATTSSKDQGVPSLLQKPTLPPVKIVSKPKPSILETATETLAPVKIVSRPPILETAMETSPPVKIASKPKSSVLETAMGTFHTVKIMSMPEASKSETVSSDHSLLFEPNSRGEDSGFVDDVADVTCGEINTDEQISPENDEEGVFYLNHEELNNSEDNMSDQTPPSPSGTDYVDSEEERAAESPPTAKEAKEKKKSDYQKLDKRLGRIERLLLKMDSKGDVMMCNQLKVNKALMPHERRILKPSWVPQLPLRKLHHLAKVEMMLTDGENMSDFTYFLEALGIPSEENEAVSTLMPKLLSNWLASHYSFDGMGAKSPFKELKLWEAIESATYMKYNTTLARVMKDMKSWLRNAKGRSGGKEPPSDDSSDSEDEEH